ncbi:hypothetical protein [Roseivivax sp. THAF30]|uniref:hypothetical protein n=1 Tax=Roseivivax sp. THAF30 TaxID=2587852 RepID=UPI0012686A7A|nr:hypothetical protein [Roseivivax sp. THAF30]QFT61965.1 hypothetical protein FIU91_03405 [Roseivivax sp. THAF30]
MTNSLDANPVSSRVERLIELLETLLERRTDGSLADRLDDIIDQLSRLERAMTSASRLMDEAAPRLTGAVTLDDLQATERRMEEALARHAASQAEMASRIDHMIEMLGLPPARGRNGSQ